MIATASSLFVLWIVWPLLPKRPVPGISILVNRVTPGPVHIDWKPTGYFRTETWDELNNLHLKGELHGGVQSTQALASGDRGEIEVAVIALQPIDHEYRLAIPAAGHVVYVLENGQMEPHPQFTKKDKRTITLRPGADPKWDGGQVKVGDKFDPFTWYPAIPRVR